MADKLTPEQRHKCMSNIHGKDTKPEMKVRKALFALGYRYRIHVKKLPGKPDIVMPKYRTIIYVNGCFWHGHKGCRYFILPSSNQQFWKDKIERNQERDNVDYARAEALGWKVITLWECELKSDKFDSTINSLTDSLKENKLSWEKYIQSRKEQRLLDLSAKKENKRKKEILDEEVSKKYHIPAKIKKLSQE